MMTRADFQALALALHRTTRDYQVVQAIANACEASNPRFDRVKFYRAAGLEIAAQGEETLRKLRADKEREEQEAVANGCNHSSGPSWDGYCEDCGAYLWHR